MIVSKSSAPLTLNYPLTDSASRAAAGLASKIILINSKDWLNSTAKCNGKRPYCNKYIGR